MTSNRKAADAYRKAHGLIKETSPGPTAPPRVPSDARAAGQDSARRPGTQRHPPEASAGDPPNDERAGTVATLLALLGRDEAANILRRMPATEAERVMASMATIGDIPAATARRVLARFGAAARDATHTTAAGPETARELLVRAFGVEDGERRFYRLMPDERPRRFAFLADADGHQLSFVVRDESAATLAVLVANLPRAVAARLLEALPADSRAQVVRRVATIGEVDGSVIDSIESKLRERLAGLEQGVGEAIDGEDRLATILRFMDLASGDRILASVRERDPELAVRIEERLATFDDIAAMDDRSLQRVLRHVDDIDLAIVLKGKSAESVARIEANVSQRRRAMIRQEREHLGPMARRDVDRATADFMQLVRELAASGEIGDLRG